MAEHTILCLNSGSSSLKFALYRFDGKGETLLAKGEAERIGLKGGRFWIRDGGNILKDEHADFPNHKAALSLIWTALERLNFKPLAVGHRVVHGGREHTVPLIIDALLLDELRRLVPFAPLHLPAEIQGIEAVAERFPELPQVACFDTAFHRHMPQVAQRLPIERKFWDEGILRYGFHGLSYEYIVQMAPETRQGRTIIAHLGNGVSLAAVHNGQPMDTTMSFTPNSGLMMGTRSGDLDPGILLYLMQEKGYDAAQIETLVNHRSGLLGVSGISSDMKALLEETAPAAVEAIDMFCYQLRKQIGALAAVLGGLDTLVFTGGIGEKAAPVREMVCQKLEFLGIRLDAQANNRHADVISSPQSACKVMVVPTKEDLIISRQTYALTCTCRGKFCACPSKL